MKPYDLSFSAITEIDTGNILESLSRCRITQFRWALTTSTSSGSSRKIVPCDLTAIRPRCPEEDGDPGTSSRSFAVLVPTNKDGPIAADCTDFCFITGSPRSAYRTIQGEVGACFGGSIREPPQCRLQQKPPSALRIA